MKFLKLFQRIEIIWAVAHLGTHSHLRGLWILQFSPNTGLSFRMSPRHVNVCFEPALKLRGALIRR